MKTIFNIQNNALTESLLLVSIGHDQAASAVTSPDFGELEYLQSASLDAEDWDNWKSSLPLHTPSYQQTLLVLEHPENLLVPASIFRQEDMPLYLDPIYGTKGCRYHADYIPGWQLYNVYAVPVAQDNWINQSFAGARPFHRFTALLQQSSPGSSGGQLLVEFRMQELSVLAFREGKLLLGKTTAYQTPEDVLYSLLAICRETGLSPDELTLTGSGWLDQQSALYKELYLYFRHFELRSPGWQTGEYPDHFFTAFKDLQVCVS